VDQRGRLRSPRLLAVRQRDALPSELSSGTGSGCRQGVDVSIFGAVRPSHPAVALASPSVGTETARRRKGAEGRSSTHTTGLRGRMATKSIPAWWLRVPMHLAPGIQTPRSRSPRRARHQSASTVTRHTAVSGTRTSPRRAAALSRHDRCRTRSSPSTNIRAIARLLPSILVRKAAGCRAGAATFCPQGRGPGPPGRIIRRAGRWAGGCPGGQRCGWRGRCQSPPAAGAGPLTADAGPEVGQAVRASTV